MSTVLPGQVIWSCRVLGNGPRFGPACSWGWGRLGSFGKVFSGESNVCGVVELVVSPALLARDQYLGSINFSKRK